MDRRRDPRTIVTPYAFSVHPDLLGRPLATPVQRLAAISIDLLVVFGLTRIHWVFLALASGILLFWLAIRRPAKDGLGKVFRAFVGCTGFFVLGTTVVVMVVIQLSGDPEARDRFMNWVAEFGDSAGVTLDLDVAGLPDSMDLGDFARLVPGFMDLGNAETEEEARTIAEEMAAIARAGDVPLQEIRNSLTTAMPDDAPWSDSVDEIVDGVLAGLRQGSSGGSATDSETLEGTDRPQITDSLALDSIGALNQTVVRLDEELQDVETALTRTQGDLEELENAGLMDWFLNLIDDLGLGFGWAALYLTVTHAWWKGFSVGKKILGIRVVMIDKRPLNWWLSFERAGGYAAGFATGLLGFAQVFWDPNRQAIHDKVSETIVIQDRKAPVPGPWVAEGRARWEKGRERKAPSAES